MKKFIIAYFLLFAWQADATTETPVLASTTLHLVGDSTMSYKPNAAYPERGWGQLVSGYVLPQLSIKNHAANGRSTKRFVDEGRWNMMLSSLSAGDYVLIQFGHNDQKKDDPARFADANTDYTSYLITFIEDVRKKDAQVLIASSICRRHFTNEGVLKRTLLDYAHAAKAVASEKGVPFIPLNDKSCQFLATVGEGQSQQYFIKVPPGLYARYPEGKVDNTHLNVVGAAKVAQFFVRELKSIEHPLAKYVYREVL